MRTNKSGGFTLIELLIVIAIIGILAAVLIPNLLNARVQAQNRAAQAYSSQVFTALSAILAQDVDVQPADFNGLDTAGTGECDAGAAAAASVTVGGTAYNYGWPAAPGNVTDCAITGDNATGAITVQITTDTGGGPYTNGAE